MSEKSRRGVPREVWRKIDVAGPSALARFTGIRQQYASLLMNRDKTPSVEEVLRILAAFSNIMLADFVADGHAIEESVRDGHPIPMADQGVGPPAPRVITGGRGESATGTEDGADGAQTETRRHPAKSRPRIGSHGT